MHRLVVVGISLSAIGGTHLFDGEWQPGLALIVAGFICCYIGNGKDGN